MERGSPPLQGGAWRERIIVGKSIGGHFGIKSREVATNLHVSTHWICLNLRNALWQKCGGFVHPSPPVAMPQKQS